jgi:hypothetical protein
MPVVYNYRIKQSLANERRALLFYGAPYSYERSKPLYLYYLFTIPAKFIASIFLIFNYWPFSLDSWFLILGS